jgi:hypothetical protein
MVHRRHTARTTAHAIRQLGSVLAAWLLCGPVAPAFASSEIYRWVDTAGVVHLSSERPPTGVKYERLTVPTSSSKGSSSGTRSRSATGGTTHLASASSSEQVAQRNAAVAELQNRECVVALESHDRLAHGTPAADPAELRRLEQTIDRTCSREPARRGEQEQMAARLRVAKGDVCVDARNRLAEMLEPGRKPTRDQVKSQSEFIENYCSAPVR